MNKVENHIKKMGGILKERLNEVLCNSHLKNKICLGGLDQNPTWITSLGSELDNLRLRAWLVKQFMEYGILVNWFTLTYKHRERHINLTCNTLRKILNDSFDKDYLSIPQDQLPRPVFRKYQHWKKSDSEY